MGGKAEIAILCRSPKRSGTLLRRSKNADHTATLQKECQPELTEK